ncbi:MAG TPA: amino acid ABC transporter ATP-binding protein [Hyphomicrobiaceae bacterium]|nr:amino acid ABC transporter ATP-binding protein [Hyphomicrobiaceae bacterium]
MPMVEITGVGKHFGAFKVLDDVSVSVPAGRACIVIGPSGSGKSTLLRCINFLEPYEEGSIRVAGQIVGYSEVDGKRKPRARHEISLMRAEACMVFQQFNLFNHMTALDNVAVAPIKVRGQKKAHARSKAKELLTKVGLSHRIDSYPSSLSGGEQQRVAIARALAMEPKVLLLDEITSALDPERVGEVLEVIRALVGEGMTMLIVTHEMGFARDVADQVVFMDKGRVVEQGGKDMLSRPTSERLQAFLGRMETQPSRQ